MSGYFVHDYSQEMGRIFGAPVYWYGAVYTIGFVGIFLWLFFRRNRIGLNRRDVFEFMIFVATGILIGGRAFDIAVYEFEYYRQHPLDSLNWWKGGLASHGVLIGSATAVILFCWLRQKPFVRIADELVVPAALLFAVGRIGNFIEGGVIGAPTNVPWAFIYEDLVEPRHPVALYESMKNFLIVPILILILRRYPAGKGVSLSVFILLYALLRFLVDLYRDYESYWWGLNKGQYFNLVMTAIGIGLLIWFLARRNAQIAVPPSPPAEKPVGIIYPILFALLALYPLGIPTSWTQVNIDSQREQLKNSTPVAE